MSTGNEFLDKALVLHLNNCNRLLLVRTGAWACGAVLDTEGGRAAPLGPLCGGAQHLYLPRGAGPAGAQCPAATISEQHPGLADAVCVKLVEDVLNRRLPRRPGSTQGEQVTIFQYWSHFESLGALVLDTYMMELAEEALLAQNLNSDDQDVVLRALKRMPEGRLKKEGLKALSLLLVEGNSKVVSAVSAQLRSLAENPRFHQRALVCYLEQLEDEEVQTRVAGCAALGCLKLVYLCQTDKEPVREAAKQSLMLCGEDGKSAHRRLEETLDSLPRIFAPASMASTAF
nr:PREDICTED: protein FAM65A-like [Phalacrocorax carbo]